MLESQEVLPYYLFGIYVLEIAKFFNDRFRNKIIIDDNANEVTITLNANCINIAAVATHINTQLKAAGIINVIAYVNGNYIKLSHSAIGPLNGFILSNGTVTALTTLGINANEYFGTEYSAVTVNGTVNLSAGHNWSTTNQSFKIKVYSAKSLQVVYGTPRAAFRYVLEQTNGKIVLPMMNFFSADVERNLSRERPGVNIWSLDSFEPATGTIAIMRSPMHFNVTFSMNLWANNYRERDYIMHEIFQSFPMEEVSLVYFPDTSVVNGRTVINDRNSYLLMPLKLDSKFTDETAIEGLDQKEVRDAIKTVFTIKADTIVPYNCYRVPIAMSVGVVSNMQEENEYGVNETIEKYIENTP